ncbi:hypothetical protein N431DRAFT_134798 [Stipitochalara longipes BDJ]|nr:hypothetical protein N431DRAFT_134798 [Stipitochalara longipes BDJ]
MASTRSPLTVPPQPEPQILHLDTFQPRQPSFPLFPLLPPELRNKIWFFSLPGPRLIYLSTPSDASHPQWGCYPFSKSACFPRCAPIPLLSICRESRAIALPLYTFVTYLHPRYLVPFSPEQDIIVMDLQTLKAFMRLRTWKKKDEVDEGHGISVRRLVLNCYGDSSPYKLVSQTVRYFGNLEEVIFCWTGGEGKEGQSLEMEKSLMAERYRARNVGWSVIAGGNCWKESVVRIRIPRIVGLKYDGESEGDIEEKIWGMERMSGRNREEVACAVYWGCHELVRSGKRCPEI